MPRTERRAPTSMSSIIEVLFCSAADKSTVQAFLTLADLGRPAQKWGKKWVSAQRLKAGCPFGHRCHLHASGISCSNARSSPWLRRFFVTCASAVATAAVLGLNFVEGGPAGDSAQDLSDWFSVDIPAGSVSVAPDIEL